MVLPDVETQQSFGPAVAPSNETSHIEVIVGQEPLIHGLLVDLRGRGIRGVHLGVAADNENAIGFYGHIGFAVIDRDPGGVLMGLRLDGARPSGEAP